MSLSVLTLLSDLRDAGLVSAIRVIRFGPAVNTIILILQQCLLRLFQFQ